MTLSGPGVVRYTLDGNDPGTDSEVYASPLVVTPPMTVKARAYAADGTSDPSPVSTATFLSTAQFSPASMTSLKLWVRADAGVSGDANLRTPLWVDQSGQGNSLVQLLPWNQPLLVPNAAGTLAGAALRRRQDFLEFTTQLTTIRTVFWVVKEIARQPRLPLPSRRSPTL